MVFHSSLLKPWQESSWSCPIDAPAQQPEVEDTPQYLVERILHWRWVRRGWRHIQEFLVTWIGFPLDEAKWIPEANFKDRAQLEDQIAKDQPVEDTR